MNEVSNLMRIVLVEPGKPAKVVEIEHTLESMRETIGAEWIQAVYPFEDAVGLVCDDEGKFNGAIPNRPLLSENKDILDVLYGPFFICGLGKEDFCGLTEELAEKYLKMFKNPYMFAEMTDGRIGMREMKNG